MRLTVIGTFGFGDPDPGETLAAWAELAGVRQAQAYRNPEDEPSVEQMLGWAARGGVTFDSLHGVFGTQFDPSSPDEAVRKFSVTTYKSEGELVRRLGGNMVVVHPSPAVENYDGRDLGARRRQLARSVSELSEIGQSLGVEFLIENQPPYHPLGADTAELILIMRTCRLASIGFCFDTGHAHMRGGEVAALASVGSLLRMVHASDNSGAIDEHELCFSGTVDWPGVAAQLKRAKFAGPFMLEVFLAAAEVRARMKDGLAGRIRHVLGLAGVECRMTNAE